jgi:hypothetical protein
MPRILFLFLLMTVSPVISADVLSTPVTAFEGDELVILMHGAVVLASKSSTGEEIGSLSALAWSQDEGSLYALSDNAYLYSFNPVFEDGKLVAVDFLDRVRLRDSHGAALRAGGIWWRRHYLAARQ